PAVASGVRAGRRRGAARDLGGLARGRGGGTRRRWRGRPARPPRRRGLDAAGPARAAAVGDPRGGRHGDRRVARGCGDGGGPALSAPAARPGAVSPDVAMARRFLTPWSSHEGGG